MSKQQTTAELRETFLKYFEKNGHRRVASSRLLPDGDPTLLFTNAGMNQFKNLFLGLETRDYARATSSQKCLRAGGKHNDLENVGFTARHHTFFEMLGNFSFGDYFKKDAIHYGWEFVTKEMSLDKSRLYVSVFKDDDEAAEIWHKQEGVPKDRIYRFGEKDNFWRMGNSGPCGPCSEIFYDLGEAVPGDPKENVMGGSGDRFMEIWNLVFMQYNESEDGRLTPLPKPSVDTGMGLERASSVVQGCLSNYDNDLMQAFIQTVEKVTGVEYIRSFKNVKEEQKKALEIRNVAMRVLADHARATAFLIADTILPSNEGRGYVLRRIMRRALRYGRNLATDRSILPAVVETVIQSMSAVYPELSQQKNLILNTVKEEERRFFATLDQGIQILNHEFADMEQNKKTVVSGPFLFKLYDTFGFPVDLTKVIAKERGYEVDETSFDQLLESAKEVARSSWKGKGLTASESFVIKSTQDLLKKWGATPFTGYESTNGQSHVVFLSDGQTQVSTLKAEQMGLVVLKETCFYPESGGQVGDTGQIVGAKGLAEVLTTTKTNDICLHHVRIIEGEFHVDELVHLKVDLQKRRSTANNHSATHLLHAALRKVLGGHVTQAGSLVAPDKLRFDFTHNKPVTPEEITAIEKLVNHEIGLSYTVETRVMSHKDALAAGAMALFGEKYNDQVRVLKMSDFSMELCGGTHVENTAMIRFCKIVSESGVSSGVRRIEAITGESAAQYLQKNTAENLEARATCGFHENWLSYMSSENKTALWIERAKEEKKTLEREIQKLKGSAIDVDQLVAGAEAFEVGGQKGRFVFADLSIDDRDLLSQVSDRLKDKIGSGVIIIVGRGEGSHPVIVSITKDFGGKLNAGKILGEVTLLMGGRGGGRPDFAQGAAKDLSKISQAKQKARELLH